MVERASRSTPLNGGGHHVISRAAVLQEAGGVALQAVSNALLLVVQVMPLHEDEAQLM